MNRLRPITWLILIIAAGLLGWQFAHKQSVPDSAGVGNPAEEVRRGAAPTLQPRRKSDVSPGLSAASTERPVATDAVSATPKATAAVPTEATPVPETAESSSLPAATVLENMRTSIRQYAATFGENPIGNNMEITQALQGANPKQINFVKEDGNRVNSNGELVDVWGTPYFFHQISGHEMEIRSAGPDRVMYTADDLVIR
jgi:hypothetical protein